MCVVMLLVLVLCFSEVLFWTLAGRWGCPTRSERCYLTLRGCRFSLRRTESEIKAVRIRMDHDDFRSRKEEMHICRHY